MGEKIYAKQTPPEFQESPLFYDELCFPDNVIVCGNRDYVSHKTDLFRVIESALKNMLEEVGYGYNTITEAIMDYIPPKKKARYSTKEINEIKNIIEDYVNCRNCDKDDYLCDLLSIVDGRKWEHRTIRGVMQSEWQIMFYPVDEWCDKDIDHFEMEYFNTGTEWCVTEEGCETGYTMYLYSGHESDIKKEISERTGVETEDIVLYVFDGYVKTPKYKII